MPRTIITEIIGKKDKIIQDLLTQTKQQQEELLEHKKQLDDLKNVEKEYFNMLKTIANNDSNGKTINNNINNNIKNLNMFYVINNFKNAHNYEDLMSPPLTAGETKYILENGALSGCYNLITKRCIDGIYIEQRPIHCVDGARSKYLLHTDNDWNIDNKCEQILNRAYPKIKKVFDVTKEFDYNDEIAMNKHLNDARQIICLEKDGRKKIVNELNKKTLLKNNVKPNC